MLLAKLLTCLMLWNSFLGKAECNEPLHLFLPLERSTSLDEATIQFNAQFAGDLDRLGQPKLRTIELRNALALASSRSYVKVSTEQADLCFEFLRDEKLPAQASLHAQISEERLDVIWRFVYIYLVIPGSLSGNTTSESVPSPAMIAETIKIPIRLNQLAADD